MAASLLTGVRVEFVGLRTKCSAKKKPWCTRAIGLGLRLQQNCRDRYAQTPPRGTHIPPIRPGSLRRISNNTLGALPSTWSHLGMGRPLCRQFHGARAVGAFAREREARPMPMHSVGEAAVVETLGDSVGPPRRPLVVRGGLRSAPQKGAQGARESRAGCCPTSVSVPFVGVRWPPLVSSPALSSPATPLLSFFHSHACLP